MKLICNGCSHTAGAEIDYPLQGQNYNKAWGYHLANNLGYDYKNFSMSGSSVNRVVRTTYEFIYSYLKDNKDFKKLLMVILWPGVNRTEMFVDQDNLFHNYDDKWTPMVVGNEEQYKETFPKSLYHYFRSWTVNRTPYQASYEFYIAITNLQNLLHRYGIKYLFMDSANSGLALTDRRLDQYRVHIDKRYYEGFDIRENSYTTLCHNSGQKIAQGSIDSGFNSHYDEDAQIWFAKHIEHILYKRNIL